MSHEGHPSSHWELAQSHQGHLQTCWGHTQCCWGHPCCWQEHSCPITAQSLGHSAHPDEPHQGFLSCLQPPRIPKARAIFPHPPAFQHFVPSSSSSSQGGRGSPSPRHLCPLITLSALAGMWINFGRNVTPRMAKPGPSHLRLLLNILHPSPGPETPRFGDSWGGHWGLRGCCWSCCRADAAQTPRGVSGQGLIERRFGA